MSFDVEAVDGHALLCPAPAPDADVARRDVPAALVDGHADGLALPGHRNRGQHDDEPGVAQAVVDPASAEHGVLHLDDEGVVGAVQRFVPVRQRDLQQRPTGRDEVRFHADATVRIVEAIGTDHLHRTVGPEPPRLGRSPLPR